MSEALAQALFFATYGLRILSTRQPGTQGLLEADTRGNDVAALRVSFGIAPVPQHEAIVRIQDHEAFGHHVQRIDQGRVRRAGCHLGPLGIGLRFGERLLGAISPGDIFVGCDPAAIRHRAVADLKNATVGQFDHGVVRLLADREAVAPIEVFVFGHGGEASRLEPQIDDLSQQHAWPHALRWQIVHVEVAAIADDEPLLAIEEAQALRHIVERGVEAAGDLARLRLLVKGSHLGSSCAFALGEQLHPRRDQVYQIPVVSVHHPDEQDQRQAEIEPNANQQCFAREYEPQRDRERGEQQREAGGARKARKAIGASNRAHEDQERDRSALTRIDPLEQRQCPDREGRVERGSQDASLEKMFERLFCGRRSHPQL